MKDHTTQHNNPTSLTGTLFGAETPKDTALRFHFKISSSFTKRRAEIHLQATIPGQSFFNKKWKDNNITVEQVMVRGRMIYRFRLAKGKEVGHGWCGHDVTYYPFRIRHVATTGRKFYQQHSQAVHHSLLYPERVREFTNRIDLIMARPNAAGSHTNDKKSKQKFERGDQVVVKGSPDTVMAAHKVSRSRVTCVWNTPAGKPYQQEYHQDVLEHAPPQKR